MKCFFTLILFLLFFNLQLVVGQSVDQQEREKIAMSRFADELENSSAASGILWDRIAITIILFGVLGMFNEAKDKKKWQFVKQQQREIATRNHEIK